MALGRVRQLRLHAVNQASLVWALTGDVRGEQLQQFTETGTMDEVKPERLPYDPSVLQQLQQRV